MKMESLQSEVDSTRRQLKSLCSQGKDVKKDCYVSYLSGYLNGLLFYKELKK